MCSLRSFKGLGIAFFIEQLHWLLLNYVLVYIRKQFLKRKVNGEIAFESISLFQVQIQEVNYHKSICLVKFAEFYYHKIFEARSQWWPKHLHGWAKPLWPLEIGRFINVIWSKGNDATTPIGEVPCQLLSQSCFYCPNLITVAPL